MKTESMWGAGKASRKRGSIPGQVRAEGLAVRVIIGDLDKSNFSRVTGVKPG